MLDRFAKALSSGIQQYDIDSFQSAIPEGSQLEFTFIDALLDDKTAPLAAGYQAICIFVNDICDANVIAQLSELGVVRPHFDSPLFYLIASLNLLFMVSLCRNSSRYDVQVSTTSILPPPRNTRSKSPGCPPTPLKRSQNLPLE